MRKFLLLVICTFLLTLSSVYAADTLKLSAETLIDGDKAYVDDEKGYISQQPYIIAGDTAKLVFKTKSTETLYDICFDFKGFQDKVQIKKMEVPHLFGLLIDNYNKNINVDISGFRCLQSFSNSDQLTFDMELSYAGKGKLKYDILILPAKYGFNFDLAKTNKDLIVLDPYVIGDLNESTSLALYMPFNNNANVLWSMVTGSYTSSAVRLVDTESDESYTTTRSDLLSNPTYAYDNNLATYAQMYYDNVGTTPTNEFYVAFRKNTTDTGAKWQHKYSNGVSGATIYTLNLTVPDACFNAYANQLSFRIHNDMDGGIKYNSRVYYYCDNGVAWQSLADYSALALAGIPYFNLYETGVYMTNQSGYSSYSQSPINTSYVIVDSKTTGVYNFKLTKNGRDTLGVKNGVIKSTGIKFTPIGAQFNLKGESNVTLKMNTTFSNLSFAFRIKVNDTSAASLLIDTNNPGATNRQLAVYIANGATAVQFSNVFAATASCNHNIADGLFHDYVFNWYTNKTIKGYLNGALCVENTNLELNMRYGEKISIGGLMPIAGGTRGFSGTVDYFYFYNRTLNPSEIQYLYQQGNYTTNKLNEVNKSIRFKKDSIILFQNNSLPTGNQSRTFSFWIKNKNISTSTTAISGIYSTQHNTAGQQFAILIKNNKRFFLSTGGAATNFLYLDDAFNTLNWVHIALTYDGTTMKVYKNGILKNSTNTIIMNTKATPNQQNQIGSMYGFTTRKLDADLDEFMIFNRALSQSEIWQLAAGYNSSANIRFMDEELQSLTTSLINFDIMSPTYSREYTTSNGLLFVNAMPNELVTFRYGGSPIWERFYYLNLTDVTNLNITLYTVNQSRASEITATVYDAQGVNTIEGAYIKVLRYYPTNNSYIMVEMAKTDNEGKARLHLIKNNEYYRFMVFYGYSTLKLYTNPYYIYEDNINFQISTDDAIGQIFDNTFGIVHNLSYNNATQKFRYVFSNVDGATTQTKLEVYKLTALKKTLVNSSTLTATSGTMLVKIPLQNGSYVAQAKVIYPSQTNVVDSLDLTLANKKPFGNFGLFLIIIVTLIFVFIGWYSITAMLVMLPLPLLYGSIIGLVNIDFRIALLIEAIALVFAVKTKQ